MTSTSPTSRAPRRLGFCARTILLLTAGLLSGCATQAPRETANDPFEPVNRAVYAFNSTADKYVLRPVAKGYNAVLPQPVRTSVGNFFDNLKSPVIIVNDFLQGDIGYGIGNTGRLLINSTVGLLGFFDPASRLGFERRENDFGKTFAVWGFAQGPYIVLPIAGPATFRSGIGLAADAAVDPLLQWEDSSERSKMVILWYIQRRAALVGPDEAVYDAYDPYLFVRDAYLQNRRRLIEGATGDGDTFEEDFEDF